MDIDAVKTRLVEIEAPLGITGYLRAPMDIDQTKLPVALHYIRQASHDQEIRGENLNLESRTILIRLLVVQIQSGVSGEAEEEVEPWIELLGKALLARPSLTSPVQEEPLARVQKMSLVTDSGVIVIPYPTEVTRYLGVDFTLNINYLLPFSLAAKE